MSGRKRKSTSKNNVVGRKWTKTKYVTELSNIGIAANETWTLNFLSQLYDANMPNHENPTATDNNAEGVASTSTVNVPLNEVNSEIITDTVQNNNAPVRETVINRTEEILVGTTSALKTATETLAAMSSLVKGVLNKDSPTSSDQCKSLFDLSTATKNTYGQLSNNTNSIITSDIQTYSRQQIDISRGVVYAEDLPKMDYVSATLRKQILEGKDINLACLLTPKYDSPQSRTLRSEGLSVELSTPRDPRLDYNLTLDEFNKAFRKYRNIVCKVYPQRRDELEQYESDLNDIAHTYGPRFYTYHKMFTAKAAAAITEHNIVINWAKVDERLLNQIMHGTPSKACDLCNEFDHQTRFCERQKYQSVAMQDSPNAPRKSEMSERNRDKHGRTIARIGGKQICNNFNYSSCSRRDCPFIHACSKCNATDHSMNLCQQVSKISKSTQERHVDGKNIPSSR